MKFVSTRGHAVSQSATECLLKSLAEDGGLYVPEHFPKLDLARFSPDMSMAEFGAELLLPFFKETELESHIRSICEAAFNFSIPLVETKVGRNLFVLELFHGATAAFKDVGARFLSHSLAHLGQSGTVIVATSGDTGGAVASAFANRPGFRVVILYPRDKISKRQEKQLTSWGPSVRAFSVNGTFDDCQRMVKTALADSALSKQHKFISANSISIGRLLPQVIYHARASLQYRARTKKSATLIVPTGNLGNAVAALWAKKMLFPIDRVILATNANRTLYDYFESGRFEVRTARSTLANAMDVSAPSNFERLAHLYPDFETLKKDVMVFTVLDSEIEAAISSGVQTYGHVWCPHTATAVASLEKAQSTTHQIDAVLVATAHPAKFETVVEPLIGNTVQVPPLLAETLRGSSVSVDLEPDFTSFKRALG